MMKHVLTGFFALAAAFALASAPARAETKREKAEELVADAAQTIAYFANDSAFEPLWDIANDAKALVVIPSSIRGGFIFGGAGGNALMIARTPDGGWSEPTFFTIGSFSFGLQAGVSDSEVLLAIMTNRGMEQMLSTNVKLGGDLSLAAGPVGGGAKAATVDVLAFSRSRGLYGGVSLEGSILKARHSWNEGYYGVNDITPADIIFREKAARPNSAPLQNAAWALAQRNELEPVTLAPLQPTQVDPVTGEPLPDNPTFDDDAIYGAPIN